MSRMVSARNTLPAMTTRRSEGAAVTLNGKLFVVGGSNGIGLANDADVLDSMEYYDDVDGSRRGGWTQVPSKMSQVRLGFAAAAIGNKIYVAGGFGGKLLDSNSAEVFDVDTGLWSTIPPMRTKRWGCTGVAVDDEFFVFGGEDYPTHVNMAESFHVKTGVWKDLPPMTIRRSNCAAAVINNKIYVVGGEHKCDDRSFLTLDTVEVFDLTTRTWSLLPQRMTTRRHICGAAAVGNLLVVAGGSCTSRHDGALDAVEVFNVDTETWTQLPAMSTKRWTCAAAALGGAVYVIGGEDETRSELDLVEEMQFNDDIVKGMLLGWSGGSWSGEVAPVLHRRTSVVHQLDVDITLMPALLSGIGGEGRVQTVFEIVRGEMTVFHGHMDAKEGTKA